MLVISSFISYGGGLFACAVCEGCLSVRLDYLVTLYVCRVIFDYLLMWFNAYCACGIAAWAFYLGLIV